MSTEAGKRYFEVIKTTKKGKIGTKKRREAFKDYQKAKSGKVEEKRRGY